MLLLLLLILPEKRMLPRHFDDENLRMPQSSPRPFGEGNCVGSDIFPIPICPSIHTPILSHFFHKGVPPRKKTLSSKAPQCQQGLELKPKTPINGRIEGETKNGMGSYFRKGHAKPEKGVLRVWLSLLSFELERSRTRGGKEKGEGSEEVVHAALAYCTLYMTCWALACAALKVQRSEEKGGGRAGGVR